MSASILRNKRKGQLHLMQTAFILIFIFIILFFGFVFYVNSKMSESEKDYRESSLKSTVAISNYFLSMPEISCSLKGDVKQSCVDFSKLLVFNASNDLDYYYDLLGNSKVSVYILYPSINPDPEMLCTNTNYENYNCSKIMVYDNPLDDFHGSEPYYIPLSIYNPFDDNYFMGYAEVKVYY